MCVINLFFTVQYLVYLRTCVNCIVTVSPIHAVCIGVLLLSLDKDTYEQLGLQGKPSKFQKQQRYGI